MRRPAQPFSWVLVVLAAICAAFFVLPLLGLLARAPWTSAVGALGDDSSLSAIRLSLVCSLLSTALALLLGVPLAWVLARMEFPGKSLLRAVATLPMVLPPVVGGVALLLAFGRRGLLGQPLAEAFGLGLPFTTPGVILAESFVAMPFLVITVEAGLRSMDVRFEEAARTLGAGRWTVFRRVTVPLIGPSLVAGAVLAWSRALGEFGATITFAGNFPGITQTAPLAIYIDLDSQHAERAVVLSLLLVVVSLAPGLFQPLARTFRVARLLDLVVVVGMLVLGAVTYQNYVTVQRLRRQVERLVRDLALAEVPEASKTPRAES